MTDTYTAVLDRFEADRAVLLLEADGETVDRIVVDSTALPDAGRHQDAVFELALADGECREIEYLPDETDARRSAAQRRFDSLSRRPPDDDEGADP